MEKSSKPTIEEIIRKAVLATRVAAQHEAKDIFKATESRLYAYPIIKMRIKDKKEELAELKSIGVRKKSKSIVRYQKSGVRLSEDEIRDVIILDLVAQIAGDEREIETIDKAVAILKGDPYQQIIELKYFKGKNDDEIGVALNCDPRTVRTHKSQLVKQLSVFLYGANAV